MSSRIPSPARSEPSLATPRRHKPRGSRSVGSPARSSASRRRLSTRVQQFQEKNKDSFALSPFIKSYLSDNTDVQEPSRKSWWKKLNDNSRGTMDVVENMNIDNVNDILDEYIDAEVLSQENPAYDLDLPDSSASESIHSIVIPQRRLLTQPQNKENKFAKVLVSRDAPPKHHKSNIADKTVDVAPKVLFKQNATHKNKVVFPAELLNISVNKTIANVSLKHGSKKLFAQDKKTSKAIFPSNPLSENREKNVCESKPKTLVSEDQAIETKIKMPAELLSLSINKTIGNKTKDLDIRKERRNLFANEAGNKRNNVYAGLIASESEDEEARVIGYQKKLSLKRVSVASQNKSNSLSTSIMDMEIEGWKMLPSSTMMVDQLEDIIAPSPFKKPRICQENNEEFNRHENNDGERNDTIVKNINEEVCDTQNILNNEEVKKCDNKVQTQNENTYIEDKKVAKDDQKSENGVELEGCDDGDMEVEEIENEVEEDEEIEDGDQEIDEENEDDEQIQSGVEDKQEDQEVEGDQETDEEKEDNEQIRSGVENIREDEEIEGDQDIDEENEDDRQMQSGVEYDKQREEEDAHIQENDDQIQKNDELIQETDRQQFKEDEKQIQEENDQSSEDNIQNTVYDVHTESNKEENVDSDDENKITEDKPESNKQSGDDEDSNEEQLGCEDVLRYDDEIEDEHMESVLKDIEDSVINDKEDEEVVDDQNEVDVHSEKVNSNIHNDDNHSNEIEDNEDIECDNIEGDDLQKNYEQQDKSNHQSKKLITAVQEDKGLKEDQEIEHSNKQIENEQIEDENEKIEHCDIEVDEQMEDEQIDDNEQLEDEEIQYDNDENEQKEDEEIEHDNQLDDSEQLEDEENEHDNEQIEDENEVIQNEEMELDNEQVEDDAVEEDHEPIEELQQDEIEGEEVESDEGQNDEEEEQDGLAEESLLDGDSGQEEVVDESQEKVVDESQENISDNNQDTEMSQEENETDSDKENEVELDDNNDQNEDEEVDDQDEQQSENDGENRETTENQEIQESPNVSHDTTGRNRKKPTNKTLKSPEALLKNDTLKGDSFAVQRRNTSIRKSIHKPSLRPSLASARDSFGSDSSAQGSGWDSHRTTRKTLRQTFGKDFTPRKSLRALVMEKSAQRQTFGNITQKVPQANSTELAPESSIDVSEIDHDQSSNSTSHDVSRRTKQATLENFLQKVKKDTMTRRLQAEKAIKQALNGPPVNMMQLYNLPTKKFSVNAQKTKNVTTKPKRVLKSRSNLLGVTPEELLEDLKYKPPKRFMPNDASWTTKRLYKYLETKLEPKYDYKARLRAEKLVEQIYKFAKYVRRHDRAPQDAVDELKAEMARLNVVATHFEFYDFFHQYMPREIRIKVVPDIRNQLPLPREGVFANILCEDVRR